MQRTDLYLEWRKSSRSSNGASCVEVAFETDAVHTRDSKNPDGHNLTFPPVGWRAFIDTVKASQ